MEAIEIQTGVKVDHVPYKTIGQITQDLQGGVLKIAYLDAGSAVGMAKTGCIRPPRKTRAGSNRSWRSAKAASSAANSTRSWSR